MVNQARVEWRGIEDIYKCVVKRILLVDGKLKIKGSVDKITFDTLVDWIWLE